jgi:hypothetical protein
VLPALASWEDFWRVDFGDPVGPPATLAGTVGYLMGNLDSGHRAAARHHAFDEFAFDVRRLRAMVRHAASLADEPVEAPAECFDCGQPLLRTYAQAAVPADKRSNRARRAAGAVLTVTRRQRAAERSYGLHRLSPWPLGVARAQAKAARAGSAGEGLVDTWTCSWCRRVYTQTEYFVGLRVATSSWVSVPLAAKATRLSVRTVRAWATRLLVASACRVTDRAVVVWWPDVSDRAFRHADDDAQSHACG